MDKHRIKLIEQLKCYGYEVKTDFNNTLVSNWTTDNTIFITIEVTDEQFEQILSNKLEKLKDKNG